MRYQRLFDYVPVDRDAFYIVAGDFVTAGDGSGIVHIAPAFGVDDYEMMKQYDLPFVLPVTTSGRFTEEVRDFAGRLVKTIQFATHKEEGADQDIVRMLKANGRVFRATRDYMHSYPHCWRCDNPLIYYARDSWYIRTTAYAHV
jgi:isoleucyl-tRNA synthetase